MSFDGLTVPPNPAGRRRLRRRHLARAHCCRSRRRDRHRVQKPAPQHQRRAGGAPPGRHAAAARGARPPQPDRGPGAASRSGSTQGLRRDMAVRSTGGAAAHPGRRRQSRRGLQPLRRTERRRGDALGRRPPPDPRAAALAGAAGPGHGDPRDRHRDHRPARPLSARRQGRPLRRCRRRQDRAADGVHLQGRQGLRRDLDLLRGRRAHARGHELWKEMEKQGNPAARDPGLRPDVRGPGDALSRAAHRRDDGGVRPRRAGQGRALSDGQRLPLHPGGQRGLGAARADLLAGRLPADADRGALGGRGTTRLDEKRFDHLGAGDLRPGGRHHRPGGRERLPAPGHHGGALAPDRRQGSLPGGGPAAVDLEVPQP